MKRLSTLQGISCYQLALFLLLLFGMSPSLEVKAQSENNSQRGIFASYAVLNIKGGGNTFYDLFATTGLTDFHGANLGNFCSSESLVFAGGENNTYKNSGCNITNGDIFYRVWLTSGGPTGSFTQVNLPFNANLPNAGDQRWQRTNNSANLISGLLPGNYTLEVYTRAQFNECGFGDLYTNRNTPSENYRATFTVLANAAIGSITAGTNPICPGTTTNLTANGVAGANATLTWWTGAGGTGTNLGSANPLTNRGVGTYFARVTGTCGSPVETSITITTNTAPSISGISAGTNPVCPGNTTNLTANGVGGTGASVTWFSAPNGGGTNLGSGNTLSNVGPGTYYARVTGTCSPAAEASINVASATPAAPGIGNITHPTCNVPTGTVQLTGLPSGNWTITVTPGGATINGSGTTTSISGLAQGTYTFTVTNETGCTSAPSGNAVVNAPPPPPAEPLTANISTANVGCFGGTNGGITVTAFGGTPGYQYKLNNGTYAGSNVFTGLSAATYTVWVKDANGCESSFSAIVGEQAPITIADLNISPACFGQTNGRILLNIQGGTVPRTVSWTGPNGFAASTVTINNLAPGDYTLNIVDARGCTASFNYTVAAATEITVAPSIVNATCFGGTDGSISLTVGGGSGNFTYLWRGGGTTYNTEDISGLRASTYNLTITDATTGCKAARSYVVTQPARISIATVLTAVSSCDNNNGAINATASNGVAPYQYSLNGGTLLGSGLFTGLGTGTYNVTAVDANGCSFTRSVTLGDNGGDAWEANNSRAGAKTIAVGAIVNARLGRATDSDWFRFNTGTGTDFEVSLTHPSITYAFNVRTNTGVLVTPSSVTPTSKTYTLSPATLYVIEVPVGTVSLTCYSLLVTDQTGMGGSVEMLTAKGTGIEVNELSASSFPNPHKGTVVLNIASPESGKASIRLFDMQGRAVAERQENLKAGNNQVRFNNLGTGTIFYQVILGNRRTTGKILGLD